MHGVAINDLVQCAKALRRGGFQRLAATLMSYLSGGLVDANGLRPDELRHASPHELIYAFIIFRPRRNSGSVSAETVGMQHASIKGLLDALRITLERHGRKGKGISVDRIRCLRPPSIIAAVLVCRNSSVRGRRIVFLHHREISPWQAVGPLSATASALVDKLELMSIGRDQGEVVH